MKIYVATDVWYHNNEILETVQTASTNLQKVKIY